MSPPERETSGLFSDDGTAGADAINRFEDAWEAGEQPSIEAYLAADAVDRSKLIKELVQIDLEYRLNVGQKPRVEDYLQRHPELEDNDDDIVDLLSHEFELRSRREQLSVKEYLKRFPRLQERLSTVLQQSKGNTTIVYQHAVRDTDLPVLGQDGKRELKIGREPLLGRFELLEQLGGGGFGTVYRAKDLELGRDVAVKLPRPGVLEGTRQVKRFVREAQTAGRLNHPNICPVYGIEQCDGIPFIVMGYIPGKSLAQLLASGKSLTNRQAAHAVYKLSKALAEAHASGIIHRDLKPSNVMIQASRRELVILDFGLARQINAHDTQLTRSGEVMGTPVYMPPEQVRGKIREIGPRSDVYSLGVILYELSTGRLPFTGSAAEVFAKILYEEPELLSLHTPSISPVLESICLKAMAKSPDERYESMEAFGRALKGFLTGQHRASRPESSEMGELEWVADAPDLPNPGLPQVNLAAAQAVPNKTAAQGGCPKCGAEMAQGVLLCNSCGFHQGLHQHFDVLSEPVQGGRPPGKKGKLAEHLADNESLLGIAIWGSLFGLVALVVAFSILYAFIGSWAFLVLFALGGVVLLAGARLLGLRVAPRSLLLYLHRATSWRRLWWPFPTRNSVDLRGVGTTDADVASLKPEWKLEVLDLEATAVTDECLTYLAELSTLRYIVLTGTDVSRKGVEDLKQTLPNARVWA